VDAVDIDEINIYLDVTDWYQQVDTQGGGGRKFSCSARARENGHLALIGAPDIRTLRFDLFLAERQPQESPPERGIGILTFQEPKEAHGWWSMPEPLYDEVWLQVREHTWRYCTVGLRIAPVEIKAPEVRWDVTKNKSLYITNASVSFKRFRPDDQDCWKINALGFQFHARRSVKTP